MTDRGTRSGGIIGSTRNGVLRSNSSMTLVGSLGLGKDSSAVGTNAGMGGVQLISRSRGVSYGISKFKGINLGSRFIGGV